MLTEQICILKPAIHDNLKLTEISLEWHPAQSNLIKKKAGSQKYIPVYNSEYCLTHYRGQGTNLRITRKLKRDSSSIATESYAHLANKQISITKNSMEDIFENST